NVPEDVFITDLVEQLGAAERDERLGVDVGKHHADSVASAARDEFAECVQTRRVDRGYVPHPDDEHFPAAVDVRDTFPEARRGTKEERPVDLVDLDLVRYRPSTDGVGVVKIRIV